MEQGGEHTHNVCNREEAQQRGVTHAFTLNILSSASTLPLPSSPCHSVRAIGSSLRLKQRFGSGYQLSVSVLPPRGAGATSDASSAEVQAANAAAVKRMFKASRAAEGGGRVPARRAALCLRCGLLECGSEEQVPHEALPHPPPVPTHLPSALLPACRRSWGWTPRTRAARRTCCSTCPRTGRSSCPPS